MNNILNKTEKIVMRLMYLSVIMNLLIYIFLAWDVLPFDKFTLRFIGGFFLLIFVCFHGWLRYGWNKMIIFFAITLTITWITETLSIETGIPFGRFTYTDLLGEKIGSVPILIIPAYFFNGYLAWTLGNIFAGHMTDGMSKKHVFIVPLVSTLIMMMWNLSFDPIMSTIEGNWIWHDGGVYFGVPLSNFGGWFITVFVIFQTFAFFLLWTGDNDEIIIRPSHWYLFPVMYMVQGFPALLYPFFRDDHVELYRVVALITFLTVFLVAVICIFVLKRRKVSYTGLFSSK